jgi:hypothetical protein
VTLSGDVNGEYLIEEVLADGMLVTRPDSSAAAIRRRLEVEAISDEEFERELGDLPQDDEA